MSVCIRKIKEVFLVPFNSPILFLSSSFLPPSISLPCPLSSYPLYSSLPLTSPFSYPLSPSSPSSSLLSSLHLILSAPPPPLPLILPFFSLPPLLPPLFLPSLSIPLPLILPSSPSYPPLSFPSPSSPPSYSVALKSLLEEAALKHTQRIIAEVIDNTLSANP